MKSANHDTAALESSLGHVFQDRDLLEKALTHSSYARETESQNAAEGIPALEHDNEQLEFLGDACCRSSSARNFFAASPNITKANSPSSRAHVVSARRLLRPARELGIGEYLHLGKGEERSGGRTRVLFSSMLSKP